MSDNDIVDPALYSDEPRLHQMLAELRHTEGYGRGYRDTAR